MPNVYVTTIFDSEGNNVTGSFNQKDFTITSSSPNPNKAYGIKNATLNFSQDNSIPYVYVNPSEKQPIFGQTTELFEWFYYKSYPEFTIDGVTPRTSGGKRIYLAPQGLVVDDETNDYYISFNLGSVYVETANGGPNRVKLAGVQNEYANVVPIIKFNNIGMPQGIEYVIGGNHEGYMTIFRGQDGNKRLGIAAYPHGIGTRTGDAKPDGFNNDWTPYYYINDDEQLTYYSFPIDNKFTENNRNSNQLLHSDEYGGNGIIMTKHFSASDFGIQHNPEFHIDPFRKIVQVDTPNRKIVESPNIFRVNLASENNSFQVVNYLNAVNIGQGATNTYQSSCLRGGHLYATYGSLGSETGKHEIRVSLINKGQNIENNQSLIDYKIYSDNEVPNFYETEGCWVNESETAIYFIIKHYDSNNNQNSTLRVFKTNLDW